MAVEIKEIRLLPPIAIARFGSATTSNSDLDRDFPNPMDNYDVLDDGSSGWRQLVPATTLRVEFTPPAAAPVGHVAEQFMPATVAFREEAATRPRIRPVAPFLEVWGRLEDDGPLVPLTTEHVAAADVRWRVHVANRKIQRRTRAVQVVGVDSVESDLVSVEITQINDHTLHALHGTCENFIDDTKFVDFGSVVYLKPTSEFPQIRLRFYPGTGAVYGTASSSIATGSRVVYGAGGWSNYDAENDNFSTEPYDTYGGAEAGGGLRGHLDDSCDGVVEVSVNGTQLRATARIVSGPPDFVPENFHVRTAEDDIQQMLLGFEVDNPETPEQWQALADQAIHVVRRAVDTVRLMYTDYWNTGYLQQTPSGATEIFPRDRAAYGRVLALHASLLSSVRGLKSADAVAREAARTALRGLLARLRRFDQTWNMTDGARRQMPAFMRGSDRGDLALTRRQLAVLAEMSANDLPDPGDGIHAPMRGLILALRDAADGSHSGIDVGGGRSLDDLFADPDALINYLLDPASVAQGDDADIVAGQRLVEPGNPDGSAFYRLVSGVNPTMNFMFEAHHSDELDKNGVEIVHDWIASLPSL